MAPGNLGAKARRHAGAAWLVLAMLAAFLGGCGSSNPGFEQVVIKGETFTLEVADDLASRTQGLMYRERIPDDGGMIFIFPDAAHRGFWMGNCVIDIDIIYLDAGGRVTAMHRMKAEEPRRDGETEQAYERRLPRYPSAYPAQFAIELKAGSLDRLGLRVEDRIDLDLARLKGLAK